MSKIALRKMAVALSIGAATIGTSTSAFAMTSTGADYSLELNKYNSATVSWYDLKTGNTSNSGTGKQAMQAPSGNEANKPSGEAPSKDDMKKGEAPAKEGEAPLDDSDSSAKEASVPEKKDEAPKIEVDDDFYTEEFLNTEDIQKLIDSIEDTDLQETLQGLLDAYTDALASEKKGLDDSDTSSDTLDTLHSAVLEARDALIDALKANDMNDDDFTKAPENEAVAEKSTDSDEKKPEQVKESDGKESKDTGAGDNSQTSGTFTQKVQSVVKNSVSKIKSLFDKVFN